MKTCCNEINSKDNQNVREFNEFFIILVLFILLALIVSAFTY